MSRIGKLPIQCPKNVHFSIDNGCITVKGIYGSLTKHIDLSYLNIKYITDRNTILESYKILNDDIHSIVSVSTKNSSRKALEMWGTTRAIINNMVTGVTSKFNQTLEINGVGYKAALKGDYISLSIGKSHGFRILIPDNIEVVISKPTVISISSIDKELMGAFISNIIKLYPPEPYKGKGIKKVGQYVHRKEGKKAK